MSTWTNKPGFGHKGANEAPMTLAEQLLSGKPVGRAAGRERLVKLRPRSKPRFGRKDVSERFALRVDRAVLHRGWKFWATLVVAVLISLQALAGIFDWPSPTLGGRQLWTDVRVQGGWRVQCHAWTGHCRLLDPHDVRRTWGNEVHTLAAMDKAIHDGLVMAPRPHAVVLVHGLGRSAHSFDAMARALNDKGLEVVRFNYASTQGTIAEHAHALNRVVNGLHGATQVSFVTHSLGGVVLRQALDLKPAWRTALKQAPSVLLAAPNRGSHVAKTLSAYAPMRWLYGAPLAELADAHRIKNLPPPAPFATVAGTNNPLWFFDAESDGLVSTAEAKLAGAKDHVNVAAAHTFIMNDRKVIDFTTRFIASR